MALKNPWNVPLHARHLGVIGIPSCNLLFNGSMAQCSISGVIELASLEAKCQISFYPGSKNHTIAHRYMLGGANIEEDLSVLP